MCYFIYMTSIRKKEHWQSSFEAESTRFRMQNKCWATGNEEECAWEDASISWGHWVRATTNCFFPVTKQTSISTTRKYKKMRFFLVKQNYFRPFLDPKFFFLRHWQLCFKFLYILAPALHFLPSVTILSMSY